jgi:CBS domain-containing protein
MAVLFFILGLFFNPFLILFALFFFFGAYGENQMVKQHSVLDGHTVEEATLTKITKLSPDNSVQEVIEIVLAGTEKDFVVLTEDRVVGIITQKDLVKHAGKPSLKVGEIMERSFKTFDISTALTHVMEWIGQNKSNFFPVTSQDKFIGVIDRVNISEFILLKSVPSMQT